MKISICSGWEFTRDWSDAFGRGEGTAQAVRLPHTCGESPLHSAQPADYEMVCGYRRKLELTPDMKGKRLFLQFDGAGHIATVYVNGVETVTHRCGYTAFRVEITSLVDWEGENRVAVRLDATENPAIPPFGFIIDYLTYGGLYREAWLDVREEGYIEDVFVTTSDLTTAAIQVTEVDAPAGSRVELSILDAAGSAVWTGTAVDGKCIAKVPAALPWDTEHPNLYTCRAALVDSAQKTLDVQEAVFGFRTVRFQADGFYLNGEKLFLRGLNRHQAYPYMGYAAPKSLQEEDARILKEELGCVIVRTSHYPQSQYFIDACDRLGLLVFTEIPGWQHIGDQAWKDQACANVKEMVLQYRNHPSVILWGVRINESQDDDPFYTRTNAIAHDLDRSRPTSGVRYIEKSHLLEDVYAFNDFSHYGPNPGVKPKKAPMTDMSKALIISEHSGHMFPTKSFDNWERRQEHALRHVRVINAAMADGDHVGCIGWCMVDYPTHKDFGSGDRVCYHGVMDVFRNPKLAAAAYASQQDKEPVLEVGSPMDIGDYPGGQLGEVYVFSNADEVALYKNGSFVTKLSKTQWTSLPHPPFAADDLVGQLLESVEGFPHDKAEAVRECLVAAARYGINSLPVKYKLKLAACMVKYKMSYEDGVALYGKYVGNWGGAATVWRFDAMKDGKVIKSVTRSPSADLHMEVAVSKTALLEGDTYDMAAVRVRIVDENGCPAPYAQLPVRFSLTGDAQLVGPDVVTAEGGMCGTYLKSAGRAGKAALVISCGQTQPVELEFTIGEEEKK